MPSKSTTNGTFLLLFNPEGLVSSSLGSLIVIGGGQDSRSFLDLENQ